MLRQICNLITPLILATSYKKLSSYANAGTSLIVSLFLLPCIKYLRLNYNVNIYKNN